MSSSSDLIVRGGPGGTTANLEDIDRCAKALRRAARAIDDAGRALGAVKIELGGAGGYRGVARNAGELHAMNLAREAVEALVAIRSGPRGLLPLANQVRDDAADVDSARELYSEAESFASQLFGIVVDSVFPFYGVTRYPAPFEGTPTLPVMVHDFFAWRFGQGLPAERMEGAVKSFAGGVVRLNAGHLLVFDDEVPILAGWLAKVSELFSVPKELFVTPTLGGRGVGKPPTSVRDLAEAFEAGKGTDGTERIQVTKVSNPDGSTAWGVTIPGTQDWSPVDGTDPRNLKSNVELMANLPSHAVPAVIEAMKLAGVGEGEPVILTGHSQGGMVAQAVAGSGAFHVVAVLTAGSPLGGRHQRSTVPTLAMEHVGDLVPATDGKENPDDPLTTTVRVHSDLASRSYPGPVHSMDEYSKTAGLVDDSDADSIVAWRKILADTFKEGGKADTRQYDAYLKDVG